MIFVRIFYASNELDSCLNFVKYTVSPTKMTVVAGRNARRFGYKYVLLNFELVLDNLDQTGNFTQGVANSL